MADVTTTGTLRRVSGASEAKAARRRLLASCGRVLVECEPPEVLKGCQGEVEQWR
jgi:hypothetical protein